MIHKLFSRNSNKAATPGGRRLYAVGDIHGCADLLDGLLALIRQDAAATPYQLVFLGDYVDRGPDSAGVLDRLVKISASTPDTIFLKGNHEAAMLDFLAAPRRIRDILLTWDVILVILLVVVIVANTLASPYFLDVYNLADASFNYSEKAIIALGMALLILVGNVSFPIAVLSGLVDVK